MWIICYNFWQVCPGLETVQKDPFIISYGDRDQRLQPIREVSGPRVMVRGKEKKKEGEEIGINTNLMFQI